MFSGDVFGRRSTGWWGSGGDAEPPHGHDQDVPTGGCCSEDLRISHAYRKHTARAGLRQSLFLWVVLANGTDDHPDIFVYRVPGQVESCLVPASLQMTAVTQKPWSWLLLSLALVSFVVDRLPKGVGEELRGSGGV